MRRIGLQTRQQRTCTMEVWLPATAMPVVTASRVSGHVFVDAFLSAAPPLLLWLELLWPLLWLWPFAVPLLEPAALELSLLLCWDVPLEPFAV